MTATEAIDIPESTVHAVAEAIWLARRLNEWFSGGFSAQSPEYREPYYHEARKAIEAYEPVRQPTDGEPTSASETSGDFTSQLPEVGL